MDFTIYGEIKEAIQELDREITIAYTAKTSPSYDTERVSGGSITDLSDYVVRIEELKRRRNIQKVKLLSERERIAERLKELPELTRKVIILRFIKGKGAEQIAKELHISKRSVYNKIKEGRKNGKTKAGG